MIRSHGRRNQHGEPTVTFKAEGVHDVMRWAIHQLSGQSEFCEVGTKTLRSLRRQIGSLAFDSYLAHHCGAPARLYPCGWRCETHAPATQRARATAPTTQPGKATAA